MSEIDSWPGQLIHQAALYNNEELLQCVLQGEERAHINAQDICGRTAVYTAVSNDALQCLHILLDNGADMNISAGQRCHNMTPLHEAVMNRRMDALALLVSRGADLSLIDESGQTPLALARFLNHQDVIEVVEMEQEKKKGMLEQMSVELCEACAKGSTEEVENLLEKLGPYKKRVINMDTKGLSPLGIAAKCGHVEILNLLLSEGAACTSQKDTGLTLLHLACESGNNDIVTVLVQTFPDLIYVRSVDHQTPLHSAVTSNRVETVRLLLSHTYHPSHQAQQQGHSQTSAESSNSTASFIEGSLPEVNARDASGDTPLHIACRNGYFEIARLLLDFKVKVPATGREQSPRLPHSASFGSRSGQLEMSSNNDEESYYCSDVLFEEEEEEEDADLEERCEDNLVDKSPDFEKDNGLSSDSDCSPACPFPSLPVNRERTRKSFYYLFPVKVNLLNSNRLSAFHAAIRYKQPAILRLILEARSPLPNKILNKSGEESILMFAYAYRNVEVLRLLLVYGHQDVESHLLSTAFFSQDSEVQCLLLTHKSSRDMAHSLNKMELRRLSSLQAQQPSRDTDPASPEGQQPLRPFQDRDNSAVHNDKEISAQSLKVVGKDRAVSCRDEAAKTKLKPIDSFAKASFRSRASTQDSDYKRRFPTSAVAVLWEGIGMLNSLETSCLEEACRLHNPMLNLNLHRAMYLCAITKVDISKNSFEQLPAILLGLPSLVILNASRNLISGISEDLAMSVNLPALEELHLNENKLTQIPRFLFQLPMLKYLDLSVNRLTELPFEVWESPALVTLRLSSNALSSLPTCVSSHQSVFGPGSSQHVSRWQQQQKESGQRRRSSSSSFQSQSRVLSASSIGGVSNYDTSFEAPIYVIGANGDEHVDFTLLSPQEVTTNQIVRVNKWASGVTVVDRDPWKGVGTPSSGLKQLWLNRNRFSNIPPCLPCCAPNLEVLVMSENSLSSVGLISDYPAALLELDLSRTGLTSTDQWRQGQDPNKEIICHAPVLSLQSAKYSIVSLDGSLSSPGTNRPHKRNSSFTAGGMDMCGRTSTSSSPVARDMIACLPPCPHRSHTSLNRLEKLHLGFNLLTSVTLSKAKDAPKDLRAVDTNSICSMESEEIQGRLLFPNIAELDLSCNKLVSLSSDIGEHVGLKILSLRGNTKLKELPPKLGLLKSLWKLELELCPLDGAIQDFLLNSRYPVKDILGFLQSVLEESTVYNSMNLMFVGFHSIGKTSLLQRLCERGRTLQKSTHWRDRVNKEESKKQMTLLSTVGIDINELLLEKRTKGPVVFRTWDFGGQREYYATHQYFLSPRSLYLVVWSIIDGERGVESLLQWLINIQARAPGAPVIIVGTHLDILHEKATRRHYPEDFEESMMLLIQKMFLSNPEPDKSGLPNILAAVNVSCKTGENIRILADMIYGNCFELKHPRSRTQHLIGQKIPRKYLLLQTIVRELALERLRADKEPVLNMSKYTLCVQNKMMEHGVTFRDVEELEQATRFLHENGVLFHYDDLPLKDLYFLDPQWLCDQLAKVITVKEINNFAQRGVMRLKNLEFLFKSAGSQFHSEHIRGYITNLLNKFEVALQFDQDHLLLPSLLPTETELLEMARRKSDVRIPLRKPSEASVGLAADVESPGQVSLRSKRSGRRLAEGLPKIYEEPVSLNSLKESPRLTLLAVKPTSNPIFSLCRLYFMTYFPSGFWSRLITRVLADGSFYNIVRELFQLPVDLLHRSPEVKLLAEKDPEWRCWQTGFELFYLGFEVMRIREVFFSTSSYFCDYSQCRIKCSIDNEWSFLDVLNSKILEITFPTDSLRFHVANKDGPQLQNLDESKPSSIVYREEVATTKLLVKMVEHVDNLLQDWYPDLGEQRFSQNCEGRYLVTRTVPCPQCLHQEVARQVHSQQDLNPWFFLNPDVPDLCMPVVVPDRPEPGKGGNAPSEDDEAGRERSYTAPSGSLDTLHRGSGTIGLPPGNRPRTLTEGQTFIYHRDNPDSEAVVFTWLVERCMLDVLEGVDSVCPMHGSVSPLYLLGSREGLTRQQFVTPDVAFQDQFQDLLLPASCHLDIGPRVGKGNFGEVHQGIILRKELHQSQHVAVKILFRQAQARSDLKRGFQGSMEQACSAYLTARQEVSILTRLEHEHIVPLVGLCLRPLALLLDLAPKGDLSSRLVDLHSRGELLPLFVIKHVATQVAKALTYLHSENIIYRDLKSDNVLIWELPNPVDAHPLSQVDVKLADYGISRTVLPTGARGFGGTPPFIAPEILQHAGKGTYSAKVDVYSFGMFMFEILTCRAPFANVSNVNNLICQGERPSLTVQEAERCPSYMLDLMCVCWSHSPDDRPTMEGVLGICSSSQFCHLQDVMTLGPDVLIYCGCPVSPPSSCLMNDVSSSSENISLAGGSTNHQLSYMSQLWLSSGFHGNNSLEILTFNHARRVDTYRTISLTGPPVLAMCIYDNLVWCVDSDGLIQIFQSESLAVVHQIQLPIVSSSTVGSGSQSSTLLGLYPCPRHQCVLAVCSEGVVYTVEEPLGGLLAGQAVVHSARLLSLPPRDKGEEQNEVNKEGDNECKKSIRCYCSVLVTTQSRCELWVGQGMGQIAVWDVSNCLIGYLSHGSKFASSSASCVFLITQSDAAGFSRHVWSYNYPGSVICQWDAITKTINRRLDCSQIVSTVNSPVLDVSERFDWGLHTKEGKGGQVSTLSAIQRFLYVGTTRGCLLVTDAVTLSPLCVFQCHAAQDFYLKLVLPVTRVDKGHGQGTEAGAIPEEPLVDDQEEDGETEASDQSKLAMPAVVTVGKGYCNTLKVFHPNLDSTNATSHDSGISGESAAQLDPFANHTFMLTWNAADWDLY